MEDENHKVRPYAAEALGEIGARQAFEPLMKTIKDSNCDRYEKRAVAEAIGSLLEDPVLNAAAATGLGNFGDSRAVEPLLIEFKHYLEGLVHEQTQAAMNIRVIQFGPQNNYNWESGCIAIAEALAKIGDARAAGPLSAALKYEEVMGFNASYAIKNSLKKIGTLTRKG